MLQTPRTKSEGGPTAAKSNDSIGFYLKTGIAGFALLVGGLGGWAASASLAGAVLAQGTVVVDSNVRKVKRGTNDALRAGQPQWWFARLWWLIAH
jgi:hypothetical protein